MLSANVLQIHTQSTRVIANGGTGGQDAFGGSGGRIAMYWDKVVDENEFPSDVQLAKISARGGDFGASDSKLRSGAGTIYTEGKNHSSYLRIDNQVNVEAVTGETVITNNVEYTSVLWTSDVTGHPDGYLSAQIGA